MIEVTYSGRKLTVNVNHIISYVADGEKSLIKFSDGTSKTVSESCEELKSLIESNESVYNNPEKEFFC